jgi:hypothetical protein
VRGEDALYLRGDGVFWEAATYLSIRSIQVQDARPILCSLRTCDMT